MLYHLFEYLQQNYDLAGSGVFQYLSFRAGMAALFSLIISIIFGKNIISILLNFQLSEKIRDLDLKGQSEKEGTPTMGGIIIIISILVPTILFADLSNIYIQLMIFITVIISVIGFIDDYLKIKKKDKVGLKGKFKILGLILIGLRSAGYHFRKIIDNQYWQPSNEKDNIIFQNEELTEKKIGFIGFGYIAKKLCEYLEPFNTKISVYDPYVPKNIINKLGYSKIELNQIFSENDVVVCLAPLTPSTKKMISLKHFNLLRDGAVFVNVSRGQIVNTKDMIFALQNKNITACLDVFDPEPIPINSKIRKLPNVFLSPHIAGTTKRSRTRFFEEMVDEIYRHFLGKKTLHNITLSTIKNRRGA